MNRFQSTLRRENSGRPPLWLMRQAGRYHSHYQALKKKHTFLELCKVPELATEVTFGPLDEFDFDAAILFSDLLFPLEAMGMGLDYAPGPKLSFHLETKADLGRLNGGSALASHMQFQADALMQIKARLPESKGLLGFVGGPLTLYYYAVEGSHQGDLGSAKKGLTDGRYEGFVELLTELLVENMAMQARAGADTVAMLDTCAGELSLDEYREFAIPVLKQVLSRFDRLSTGVPVTYYSKGTTAPYWELLRPLPIAAIGVDWNTPMSQVLDQFSDRFAIQGNFDPNTMLDPDESIFEAKLEAFFNDALSVSRAKRRGWICGLGHGVLQHTPEQRVHRFVKRSRELLGD
jgi:uroporphyrinogen decarboxylase